MLSLYLPKIPEWNYAKELGYLVVPKEIKVAKF